MVEGEPVRYYLITFLFTPAIGRDVQYAIYPSVCKWITLVNTLDNGDYRILNVHEIDSTMAFRWFDTLKGLNRDVSVKPDHG